MAAAPGADSIDRSSRTFTSMDDVDETEQAEESENANAAPSSQMQGNDSAHDGGTREGIASSVDGYVNVDDVEIDESEIDMDTIRAKVRKQLEGEGVGVLNLWEIHRLIIQTANNTISISSKGVATTATVWSNYGCFHGS